MKALFWGLLLALAASALALLGATVGGNVVFLVPPYRVDLSLFFFLLLAAAAAVALYWLAWALIRIGDFPTRVALYRKRRAEIGSQRALRDALRTLLEGRFARAERAARAAQVAPENAGLAALLGARAAHRLQQPLRRDAWLDQADADPALATATLVSGAEMWSESRDYERALAAVEHLQAAGGRHIHAMRIALNLNVQAKRWDEVLKTVRLLENRTALHPVLAAKYKLRAIGERLIARRHDAAALETAWQKIPGADRRMPELALQGARLLNLVGRGRAAAAALEAALESQWDSRLVDEYARAQALPVRERIERAEKWLQAHPNDPALLRCLGLLCARDQLWGKARSYLQDSLRGDPHPATLLAMARLAETLGDESGAASDYREAALGFARLAADELPIAVGNSFRDGPREMSL